jgi:hypothetical protein
MSCSCLPANFGDGALPEGYFIPSRAGLQPASPFCISHDATQMLRGQLAAKSLLVAAAGV